MFRTATEDVEPFWEDQKQDLDSWGNLAAAVCTSAFYHHSLTGHSAKYSFTSRTHGIIAFPSVISDMSQLKYYAIKTAFQFPIAFLGFDCGIEWHLCFSPPQRKRHIELEKKKVTKETENIYQVTVLSALMINDLLYNIHVLHLSLRFLIFRISHPQGAESGWLLPKVRSDRTFP